MHTFDLPREMVDLFVDALDDIPDSKLSPLLLVSRVFHASAQQRIFKDVTLTIDAGTLPHIDTQEGEKLDSDIQNAKAGTANKSGLNDKIKLLGEILEADQDGTILGCVKHLTIAICVHERKNTYPEVREHHIARVIRIISRSLTLESLSILGTPESYPLKLCSLTPSAIDGLIAIRSQPTLRRLTIENLGGVPPALMTGSRPEEDKLEEMRLSDIYFASAWDLRPQPPMDTSRFPESMRATIVSMQEREPEPPHDLYTDEDLGRITKTPVATSGLYLQNLRHLDAYKTPGVWHTLVEGCQGVSLGALETLKLGALDRSLSLPDEDVVMALKCAPNAHSLSLTYDFWELNPVMYPDPPLPSQLGTFTHIHTLHLASRHIRNNINRQIASVSQFITNCTPLPSIHTLTISFEWSYLEIPLDIQLAKAVNTLENETLPNADQAITRAMPNLKEWEMRCPLDRRFAPKRMQQGPIWVRVTEGDLRPLTEVLERWKERNGRLRFSYRFTVYQPI